jgi:hypothetical protein
MTAASVEGRPWSRRRWWGTVALIFIVQLGLIFWLGSRTPIRPRLPAGGVTLHLADLLPGELSALDDPTLFNLPHPEGFSGPVWRSMPRPEFQPYQWSAPTNRLPLTSDRFSAVFSRLLETSQFPVPQLPPPEAAPTLPNVAPLAMLADQSVLQLEDGLVQRRLLVPVELKSWQNPDILGNSIVRVGVDAGGRPMSVTLVSSSGLAAADQFALDRAWSARFEPVSGKPAEAGLKPAAQLSWAKMIFRWHTVPLPPASAPAAKP